MSRSPKDLDQSADTADLDLSWVSGKRRPKPQPLHADSVQVSRESGLHNTTGTFGVSSRFSHKVTGKGRDSPNKREYYGRNQINKLPQELGRTCSQGIGDRPKVEYQNGPPPNVGPGSYDIVGSCCLRKSALDGPDYCSTTMHHTLPSKLTANASCSPGPHHKYEIRKPLDHKLPSYQVEALSHGTRHHHPEDTDGPGLRNNDMYHLSVASSASCPNLRGPAAPDARGTKRCLKTTFGTADRFKTGKQTCSPGGVMGYAHFKFPTSEDYLAQSRSCSFGVSSKTDFSNPYHGHRSVVSPVTYRPQATAVKKSSALDGFASRCTSPVSLGCRNQSRTKRWSFGDTDSASPLGSTIASPVRTRRAHTGVAESGMDNSAGVATDDVTGGGAGDGGEALPTM
mmetsp:Transcript_103304/g.287557  ORF Transcript_103304/g.287557 Transcript_103304/m.287557 type:complete len:398 (-) Transcript_103304:225-1418(-)